MTTTTKKNAVITVQANIDAPVEKVWKFWTDPKHIIQWNNASDDWHTPRAENDLRVGGRFLSRMESKDGKMGFDFIGKYSKIVQNKQIEYTIDDGRKVQVIFVSNGNETAVKESFEAEHTNTLDLQKTGWQAILDNFKQYAEALGKLELIHFEIKINAPVEKVYQTMFDEKKWSAWTSEFNPTSHYQGSWKKGSKILFLGNDRDGSIGGMASRIKENIPNKFMSIEHIGLVRNGKEIMNSSEVNEWEGARENYTFEGIDGYTLLFVDADSNQKFKSYFAETWPKALKKLKALCELR